MYTSVNRRGCWRSVGRRGTHAPIVQQVSDSPPLLSGMMGVFVCLFGHWLMLPHCHTLHEYKSHTLLRCPIVSLRVTQLFQMECVLGR